MGRFLFISLSLHLLIAYMTTYIYPQRILIPFPPVHVSLLELDFEKNDDLPSGLIVETKPDTEPPIEEQNKSKLLAESNKRGGTKKRVFVEKPAVHSVSTAKKKVIKASPTKRANTQSSIKKMQVKKTEPIPLKDVDAMASQNPAGYYESGDEAVVSLNTKRFEYAKYFLSIKKGIEENWYYPSEAVIDRLGGNTLARFTLLPNGELESVAVISSSGAEILDAASIGALKLANPFKPFPSKLKKKRIHIILNFSYQPSFSPVHSGR